MNVLNDIRLIQLYKQHYLNKYDGTPVSGDYSCWGYYDFMKIRPVCREHSELIRQQTKVGISDFFRTFWRTAGELDGSFGCQSIGIYRSEALYYKSIPGMKSFGNETDFWDRKTLYITVCMIQLKDTSPSTFDTVAKRVLSEEREPVFAYPYHTTDSEDMILILKSNCCEEMMRAVKTTEEYEEVIYLQNVSGVDQPFLDQAYKYISDEPSKPYEMFQKAAKEITNEAFVNERLEKVALYLVSKSPMLIANFRKILEKHLDRYQLHGTPDLEDRISIVYMGDHENIVIDFPQTDMYTFLTLILKDGPVVHQNPIYGNLIYNITSRFWFHTSHMKDVNVADAITEEEQELSKFKEMIPYYRDMMNRCLEQGDEHFAGIWHAMLLTLNALAQYADFTPAKKVFYMVYPSLNMLDCQIKGAMDILNEESEEYKQQTRKMMQDTINQYLKAINSLISNIIHTDQIFLALPGFSGTPLDVPGRLLLFYMSFMDRVSRVMNNTTYEYSFFFNLDNETVPTTRYMELGLEATDRVIEFGISQRALYNPRDMLFLATHEIAHYVGDMRKRESRFFSIKRLLPILMTELLVPVKLDIGNRDLKPFIQETRGKIKQFFTDKLDGLWYLANDEQDSQRFHSSNLEKVLTMLCCYMLLDEDDSLRNKIYECRRDIQEREDYRKLEPYQRSKFSNSFWHLIEVNRTKVLAEDTMVGVIASLIRVYKEVYADTAALCILKPDQPILQFVEAQNVSDGYPARWKDLDAETGLRMRAVCEWMGEKWTGDPEEFKTNLCGTDDIMQKLCEEYRSFKAISSRYITSEGLELQNYMYYMPEVFEEIISYVQACHTEIERQCESRKAAVDETRRIFKLFCCSECDSMTTYHSMDEEVHKYCQIVSTLKKSEYAS